jgi:hypothetical protein
MPLNERKIVSIILEEGQGVPERCEGYRETLIETISEIVQAERQHKVQGTNIQQKVNDQCNTLGRYLASKRGQLHGDDGE